MNSHRVTPLRVGVQKLDRMFYAFGEHQPEKIFKGRSVFESVGKVLVYYRDVISENGLGDVYWWNEHGRPMLAFPTPADDWHTERFRQEFRSLRRKAA